MSVFPKIENGAAVVRDSEGVCTNPIGVLNAYCPPDEFTSTCEITALPEDCLSKIAPSQVNAIVSEMLCLAVAMHPTGEWNCESTCNLAEAFQNSSAGSEVATDGQTIDGNGTPDDPLSVVPLGVVQVICGDDAAADYLADCLVSNDANNILTTGADGRLFVDAVANTTSVLDYTQLKAINPAVYQSVIVRDLNRGGTFDWFPGNLSAQVTIDPEQGVFVPPTAAPTGASGAWVRRYTNTGPVYANWFGAVGNGATPSADGWNAAIRHMRDLNNGGGVTAAAGRYRMDHTLTVYSNIHIFGDDIELDYTQDVGTGVGTPDGNLVWGQGSLGTAQAITVQRERGHTAFGTTVANGAGVGDWVYARSTLNSLTPDWAPNEQLGDRPDNFSYYAEFLRIRASSGGGTTQNIDGCFSYRYPVGSVVRKVTWLENVTIENITFLETANDAAKRHQIRLILGKNCIIRNCKFPSCRARGIQFTACLECKILNNLLESPPDLSFADADGTTFQHIGLVDCCIQNVISGNTLTSPGQGIDITYSVSATDYDGPPRYNRIEGNIIRGSNFSAITDHTGAIGTQVIGNTIDNCVGGIYIRSREAVVIGNRLSGIWFAGAADPATPGIWFGENGFGINAIVQGNFVSDFHTGITFAGINSSISYRNWLVDGNNVHRCGRGIYAGPGNADTIGSGIVIQNNNVMLYAATMPGIEIGANNETVQVQNNRLRGSMSKGIRIDSCARPMISGNQLDAIGAGNAPIDITGCTGYAISLNVVRGTNGNSLGTTGATFADIFTPVLVP